MGSSELVGPSYLTRLKPSRIQLIQNIPSLATQLDNDNGCKNIMLIGNVNFSIIIIVIITFLDSQQSIFICSIKQCNMLCLYCISITVYTGRNSSRTLSMSSASSHTHSNSTSRNSIYIC